MRNQTFKDFELIFMFHSRTKEEFPTAYVDQWMAEFQVPWSLHCRIDDTFWGNTERGLALQLAKGKYITWFSGDNLAYPNWLACHIENFANEKTEVSLVNIDYWRFGKYKGIMPTALKYGEVDLMNFALSVNLARKIDAFGPWVKDKCSSDWYVLNRALDSELNIKVVWDRNQPVCGCHI
jgi:hypothetical protein